WEDQSIANQTISKANLLKSWLDPYKDLARRTSDVKSLVTEAIDSEDIAFLAELSTELKAIEKEVGDLEIRKMLSGEMDPNNCFLSVNAGAGGTEACDWAQMLLRMYQRWATRRGWKFEV